MVGPAVTKLAAQANVLARIAALGGMYGIELGEIDQALAVLGPELANEVIVTVPSSFDRIAVATRVAHERVAALVDRDQLRRFELLAAGTPTLELELAAGSGGAVTTLRATGSRDIASDCEVLGAMGIARPVLDSLRHCAAQLGSPTAIAEKTDRNGHAWLVELAQDNATAADRAATRAQLTAVARELAATEPQCNLVDRLHDVLAKDRDSHATLAVLPDRPCLELAVRWHHVRWETVIRMMLGFHPGSDAGKQAGEIAGAFDADEAFAIELVLGPSEPPRMIVAVTFGA